MTTQTEVLGLAADADQPRCTDPATLRAIARDKRTERAGLQLRAMTLDREADQAEHEAGLWEIADAADAAWASLRERTAGLEAAAEGTLAAQREAEDRLRDDKKHLVRRKGEATRAENGTSRDAQDEAAVRLHKSEQRVAEAETALADARQEHQAAEAALDAHRTGLREDLASWQRALDAAYNPGVAPRTSPLRVGLGRPEDMTPEEKDLLAMIALTGMSTGSAGTAAGEPRRNRITTNGEFAAQDPTKFRLIRQGTHMFAIPPAGAHDRAQPGVKVGRGRQTTRSPSGSQGRSCPWRVSSAVLLPAVAPRLAHRRKQ